MKELLPYFKLLKPVRLQFLGAILCAVVYGASSGFGLPFMTHKVFPLIFSSHQTGIELFTKLEDGSYHSVPGLEEARSSDFFMKRSDGTQVSPYEVRITSESLEWKERSEGPFIPVSDPLFIQSEKGDLLVQGGLYRRDKESKAFVSLEGEEKAPSSLTLLGAVMLLPLVFIIRGGSSFLNIYLVSYCGLHLLEQIRFKVFEKLQHLPLSFYHRHKSGDLFSRLMGDTNLLQGSISGIANDIVKQPITLLGGIGYLIYQSVQQEESVFILICFAVIGMCIFPIRFIGKQLMKRVFQMQERMGDMASIASENLGAYREVRSFNLQEREEKRFFEAARQFFEIQLKVVRYKGGLNPLVEIVTATGISVAIYYGSSKGITLNDIVPLMMALYLSYDPIKKLGNMNSLGKTGLAALRRLSYILNQVDETPDPVKPAEFPKNFSTLSFDKLNFAYEEETVLSNINLEVKRGEVVAMVGPSGAGKSTFGALIPRFYDPKEGGVLLDGIDLREVSKADLRKHVSIVSQDTFLFDDTVMGNIRLGRPDATPDEIREAAIKAQADEFISLLPEGYETRIGEKGTRLSGGQKQRLAIARAFLKEAPILILDEATSALDSESEAKIQSALETLVKGKTVFIIAHRFSTIQFATRILVFEEGKISGDGTHAELLESHNLYRDLYKMQSSVHHQSDEK